MTEQKICFTVDSNATSGLTVKSVQIDENVIDVSMNLDDNNANEIANTITNKHNAVTGAEALSPANVIVDANTQLPPVPVPVPVPVPESTVVNANTLPPTPPQESTVASAPESELVSKSKFSRYKNFNGILNRLNREGGVHYNERSTIATQMGQMIKENKSPNEILNFLNERIQSNLILKGSGEPQIALGGSHLTRKSPHNRRRRQSTIRKGHRSSRSKGKSKSRR